jgi:hypothetical protein
MDQIVEDAIAALGAVDAAALRDKVKAYICLISSTGKRDPHEPSALALAYLRKIIDGPDTRFSGL